MTVVKLHNRNLLLRWVSCPLLLACLPEKESKWREYGPHLMFLRSFISEKGLGSTEKRFTMVINTDGGDENSKDGQGRREKREEEISLK